MTIAGTGGSHRDGIRPYPHFFFAATHGLLLEDIGTMCMPYPARAGDFGLRKSGDSHINPIGSYSKRLNH